MRGRLHTDQYVQQLVIDGRQRLPPEQEAAELVLVRRCSRGFWRFLLAGGAHLLHRVLLGRTEDGKGLPLKLDTGLVKVLTSELRSSGSSRGGGDLQKRKLLNSSAHPSSWFWAPLLLLPAAF